MTKYEDCIYLRGKTKIGDIAECISKTFSDFGIKVPVFQADTSRYCLKFEIECGLVHLQWENQSLDFKFKGFINESDESISIKYNEADNSLEYAEAFTVPHFLTAFFYNCHSYYGRCLFSELNMVSRTPFEQYCGEINPVSIKTNELRVTYYADENGNLLFPQEWMERITKDLYFLNINHRYDKGISILNIDLEDEQCLKEICIRFLNEKLTCDAFTEVAVSLMNESNPSHGLLSKKQIGKIKENVWNYFTIEQKESLKSFFEYFCEHKKMYLKDKQALYPEAKIILETKETKNEITRRKFKCASYEDFCTFIINEAVKIRKTKVSTKKSESNKFLSYKSDVEYKLENKNLNNVLQKTKAELENLRKQQAELINELKSLKYQNSSAVNSGETINNELSVIINNLKTENHVLKEKNKRLEQNLNGINTRSESFSDDCINLSIPCTKKSLFKNEIEDYCYKLLYSGFEYEKLNLPQNKSDENSRKADVITDILDHCKFKWENTETFRQLSGIENTLKNSREPSIHDLSKYGFASKHSCKKHPKCYFYKERYQMTFSGTPGDINSPNLKMKEIRARCFLLPVKQRYDSTEKKRETC